MYKSLSELVLIMNTSVAAVLLVTPNYHGTLVSAGKTTQYDISAQRLNLNTSQVSNSHNAPVSITGDSWRKEGNLYI